MLRSHLLETIGFNQLAQGREGFYLYNRNDRYVGKSIERYGEFSSLEVQVLGQLCAPGEIVIEAGANIGAHTVSLARRVGPSGRVIAFEPQRLVFQLLCANVALNSLSNVDCHWAALGAEEGVMTAPEPDPSRRTNFGGLTLLDLKQGHVVDCVTLDRFLGLPHVRLIKIDVEGMETDVIKGGMRLIQKFKPFLYVENDRIERSEALLHLIDGLGYRMFWHMPPLFNPNNYFAETENIFPRIVSVNMLCIHREADREVEGLAEIRDFSFHPMLGGHDRIGRGRRDWKHPTGRKKPAGFKGGQTMATKRNKKAPKKVKSLRAKSLSAKQAKGVRGGGPTAASKLSGLHIKYDWKY